MHVVKYADFLSLMAFATAVLHANPPHAIVVRDAAKQNVIAVTFMKQDIVHVDLAKHV